MTLPPSLPHAQNSGAASPFDTIKQTGADGERWAARDLQTVMGYSRWENFEVPLNRAMRAAQNVGADVTSNFLRSQKITGNRPGVDYELTRYAAYLVAMNGDPNKAEVAQAQTYFAVKTREAETRAAVPALPQSYAEALRELAASVEERELLAGKVAQLAPAAESWNTLATAAGDLAVADAAKLLSRDPRIKIGRDRLFTVLRDIGWCYRQRIDQRHRPYQSAIDAGRLMELPSSHYHPRTGELVIDPPQVRVTVKGLEWLHQHLRGERGAA